MDGSVEPSSPECVDDEAISKFPASEDLVTHRPPTDAQFGVGAEGPVPLPSLFEGDIEEEDCPEDFLHGLYTSEVATHRHARMWLKPGLQRAARPVTAHHTDPGNGDGRQTPRDGDTGASTDERSLIRQKRRAGLVRSRGEAHEWDRCVHSESRHDDEGGLWWEEPDDTEFATSSMSISSSKRVGRGSPGTTLLSRLALAEREALRTPRPRRAGGVYGQWSDRLARIQEEGVSASDLRSLAVDRRHVVPVDREWDNTFLGTGKHYRYNGSRASNTRGAVGAPRRMRVLDLDSVSPAVLHHSFMFLLVKHLPAEICLKVLSRIAVYRDVHTQLAYENLIRDMGFLFTKHYEACTSTPHDLGPTLVAYVCRIVQTISIAWGVNYVRRFGCFSKQFIVQQIERSANPRLFDFVRYAHKGGVKPLPPIVTHPHRLSSYVRLLDESSSKFYMYTHLKRHRQLPLQQQLHASPDQVEGVADAGERFFRLDSLSPPPQGTGLEEESRLPRAFVAAEKALQPAQRRVAGQAKAGGHSDSLARVPGLPAGRKSQTGFGEKEETVKRPAIYDLILAAEHLGVDYKELQRRIQAEQEEEWSSDEDEGARELRELIDNDEVYKHIRDRYYRGQNADRAMEDEHSDDELHDRSEEETDSDIDSDVDVRIREVPPDADEKDMARPHGKLQNACSMPTRATTRAQADTTEHTASLASGTRSTLRSSARVQTTRVSPSLSSFETTGNAPFESARVETSESRASALVPVEPDSQQWGWQWEFQRGDELGSNSCASEEGDDDAAGAERWWGSAWGRHRTRFRYKGRSYGVVPGEGWKLLEEEGTLKLLKPKRRFGKHEPKRERRIMRRVTLRRVRQQVLQEE